MAIAKQTDKILIIGAGCFGTSTALHLLQRGFSNVTVIDRSPVLPAQDAASTDLNKIVRTSYDDLFYAQLAQKAIQDWKNTSLWGDTYHESGVLVISAQSTDYGSAAYKNDIALGARLVDLPDGQAIRSVIPDTVPAASFQHTQGYLNKDGGWAFAAQGVERLLGRVKSLGATIVPGKAATELVRFDDRVVGVRCADGDILEGDFIVIASGSWTACSFPEFDLGTRCFASGQCLVTIQLSPEEAARYADTPVILDWSSDTKPSKDNIVKVAVHSTGYSRYVSGPSNPVSTPQTVTSHGQEGLRIPQEVTKFLRERLGKVYPELASKPFSSTRVCWYTDSPDGDWAIGPLPAAPNVFLATSGSGHAYKFLPNIGGLVADRLEGKMDSTLAAKFAVDRVFNKTDLSRRGEALRDLSTATLCNPEDLLP